jgi:serine/threonine-protein kinase
LERLTAALADRYRIERELGAGGMATVYLAEDLKHHRKVAVKVLRPDLAATLGSERFLREIEVAARLQHPHILALHDSGEADGFLYYVMPFIEGVSLRERLAEQGELPVSDALRILTELVEALAYAHGQGVVHRDLKPDNIMLSGRHPLVMDFGIAKAVSEATGRQTLTTAGVALGTPAYMAPEQATADPHVDHRADLYAIGVIGYELLTGQPPFTGMSAQQILAAQVTESPAPISTRRPTVAPVLDALLMRCLQKRPADRPQRAEEILQVLETLATPSAGLTPTAARPVLRATQDGWRRGLLVGGAVAVLAAAAIGGILWRGRSGTSAVAMARHTQLTYTGTAYMAEISPDGQLLAYVDWGDTSRVVVKDLAGGSVLAITSATYIWVLRWAWDGTSILLVRRDSMGLTTAMIPRLGGTPRSISDSMWQFVVLSPDGKQMAGWRQPLESPITLTTLGTNRTRMVSVPDSLGWHSAGDWSPDGQWIALLTQAPSMQRWTIAAVEVATGTWHVLLSDTVSLSPPRWSSTGAGLYYLRGGDELWKLQVGESGEPDGAPVLLQRGFGAGGSGISLTADGRKLVYFKSQDHANLWLATRPKGQREFATTQLTRGTAGNTQGSLSPDGRLIAFIQWEQGKGDLFVLPIEGGTPRRITSSGAAAYSTFGAAYPAAVWSPDGQRLAFLATVQGVSKVHTVTLDGRAEHTYEQTEPGHKIGAWAPQARILYQRAGNRNFHWLDPATEAEAPLVANDSVGWMSTPMPSPDGRYVAVSWNREGKSGVYLISLRDSSQRDLGPEDGEPVGWSRDGQFVYVQVETSREIRRVPVTGGEGVVAATIPFKDTWCQVTERVSGLVLLCYRDETTSDVWMMEDFDPSLPRRSAAGLPRTP